jgi:glycosyltransferase involved in cell wall biosynthesis
LRVKSKITCIIHSLTLGGMERVMVLLINDFAKRKNVEVNLILIGKRRQIEFDLPKNIIIYKPDFKFDNNTRIVSTLKTLIFVRKTIKGIDPHTILSFGEYWNNLVLLSLVGLKYPIYISDRSQPKKSLGTVQNFLKDKLYPIANGYIVQTEKAKAIAKKNKWNKNIVTIGNPIREINKNSAIPKENIVLTVGRLIKTKHIDELINMFLACKEKNWKLVIVGGNAKKMNLLEEYRNLIKTRGEEKQVKLVGAQQNVDEYYNKSKIFAFTSSSEGFPNVIGEAMSAGLPVIAYDCLAGPSDLIDHEKTGFLIPEREEVVFQQKLNLLMQEESLREKMGKEAEIKIKEFEVQKIAQQFYDFIIHK